MHVKTYFCKCFGMSRN